jgi:hypothetical protein
VTALAVFACPICAQTPASATSSLALFAFIAAPFVVAALVARAIWKAGP